MAPSAPAKSTLFYIYVDQAWSGPFQLDQLRFFLSHGQVATDTYAYDPEQQRHYTVGDLVAAEPGVHESAPAAEGDDDSTVIGSTKLFTGAFDSEVPEATATLGTSLDALPEPLLTFYRSFRELTEGRPADRAQTLAHLTETAAAIGIQVSAAVVDADSLTLLIGDVLRLGDYLANRHQDAGLWEAIDVLRAHKPATDGEECAAAARLVIACLVERAKREPTTTKPAADPGLVPAARANVTPTHTDSQEFSTVTDSWDQPHARTAHAILRDARKELRSTEADLESIQRAYTELQESHARDLTEARELLARLESSRADEAANAAQALAEVRSLAAEIHRLADEHLGNEVDLKQEIRALADELKGSDATAMAPLAEALLIRLVTRLRNFTADPTVVPADVTALREELARSRSELVQARAQVLSLTDERDRLKRQLDEQRAAADRAIANAREREQRLRSTVTALEVTKDLHREVMRELELQLTNAQKRVGEMEGELSTVRVELTKTRTNLGERNKELGDEMRRAVELQAMLEARRAELSANLQDAEAELTQAQHAQEAPGANADPELMEALAAKVNHLRTMFEATKRRLDEQQALAAKLEEDLAASRREASELRGRSDSLTNELDDARSGLSAAKKRFEELNRAYARLESERESLANELQNRKGTDAIKRDTDRVESGEKREPNIASGTTKLSKVMEHLERRALEAGDQLEQAKAQLAAERHRVTELSEAQAQLHTRIEDLTSDRDHLRAELDRLHSESFADHSRHAASLAVATQASIDAERRLKEATARVVELEDQIAWLQANQAPPDAALSQLDADGEEVAAAMVPASQLADLRRQLTEVAAERDRLAAAAHTEAKAQEFAVRLTQVEEELIAATAGRDETADQLRTAIAERERLSRDLARLKNEQESAAVEQRVALKSARDKLVEAQARVADLEVQLAKATAQPPVDLAAAEHTASLTAERDRLAGEVAGLTARIGKSEIADELPEARAQLAAELERIKALTRSLGETQAQADAARAKATELEARAAGAIAERDQLRIDSERLRGELLMSQAVSGANRENDAGRRQHLEQRLHEVLTDREQMLSELSRVNAELMQVRGRLVRAESEAIVAERLPGEYERVRGLESQLAQARSEHAATTAQLSEVRTQLAAVTAERDQLRDEVERLRAQIAQGLPSAAHAQELASLRDKLVRAKARIRALRKEQETLLAQLKQGGSGTSVTPQISTGVLARLRSEQTLIGLDDPFSSARRPAVTPDALEPLTRRNLGDQPLPGGFTSAFGRPAIAPPPVAVTSAQPFADPATPTPMVATMRVPRSQPRARSWRLPLVGVVATVAVVAAGLGAIRPLVLGGTIAGEVRRLAAPIPGQVSYAVGLGDLLATGGTIAIIRNERVDAGQLEALEARRQALEARRAGYQAQLDLLRQPLPPDVETARHEERVARLAELESQATDTADRLAALNAEVATETKRIEALREATVVADGAVQVRRLLAAPEGRVAAKAELLEVVDPASISITADLPLGSPVAVGDIVALTVHPGGATGDGVVTEVNGGRLRVALPADFHQAALIGAGVRLAVLGPQPGRVARLGERIWRQLAP